MSAGRRRSSGAANTGASTKTAARVDTSSVRRVVVLVLAGVDKEKKEEEDAEEDNDEAERSGDRGVASSTNMGKSGASARRFTACCCLGVPVVSGRLSSWLSLPSPPSPCCADADTDADADADAPSPPLPGGALCPRSTTSKGSDWLDASLSTATGPRASENGEEDEDDERGEPGGVGLRRGSGTGTAGDAGSSRLVRLRDRLFLFLPLR